MIYANASTQGGSNHSDAAQASVPLEPRVTETRAQWRARMDAKRIYGPRTAPVKDA